MGFVSRSGFLERECPLRHAQAFHGPPQQFFSHTPPFLSATGAAANQEHVTHVDSGIHVDLLVYYVILCVSVCFWRGNRHITPQHHVETRVLIFT